MTQDNDVDGLIDIPLTIRGVDPDDVDESDLRAAARVAWNALEARGVTNDGVASGARYLDDAEFDALVHDDATDGDRLAAASGLGPRAYQVATDDPGGMADVVDDAHQVLDAVEHDAFVVVSVRQGTLRNVQHMLSHAGAVREDAGDDAVETLVDELLAQALANSDRSGHELAERLANIQTRGGVTGVDRGDGIETDGGASGSGTSHVRSILDAEFSDRIFAVEDGFVWVSGMNQNCRTLAERMAQRLVSQDVPCGLVHDDAVRFGGVQFRYDRYSEPDTDQDDLRADGGEDQTYYHRGRQRGEDRVVYHEDEDCFHLDRAKTVWESETPPPDGEPCQRCGSEDIDRGDGVATDGGLASQGAKQAIATAVRPSLRDHAREQYDDTVAIDGADDSIDRLATAFVTLFTDDQVLVEFAETVAQARIAADGADPEVAGQAALVADDLIGKAELPLGLYAAELVDQHLDVLVAYQTGELTRAEARRLRDGSPDPDQAVLAEGGSR